MMTKGICVPYAVDQNEPSRPINQIINLPTNIKERDKILKELFIKHVCPDFQEDELHVSKGNKNDYGDLIVEAPHDLFLFVTFIKE